VVPPIATIEHIVGNLLVSIVQLFQKVRGCHLSQGGRDVLDRETTSQRQRTKISNFGHLVSRK